MHANLHVVFRNLVILVITSGKTTQVYRELQVSHKLEHGPWHYIFISTLLEKITLRGSESHPVKSAYKLVKE